jgi:Phage integrase family
MGGGLTPSRRASGLRPAANPKLAALDQLVKALHVGIAQFPAAAVRVCGRDAVTPTDQKTDHAALRLTLAVDLSHPASWVRRRGVGGGRLGKRVQGCGSGAPGLKEPPHYFGVALDRREPRIGLSALQPGDGAGAPAGHPHALRHTFATALAEAGVDLAVLRALMSHDHVSTRSQPRGMSTSFTWRLSASAERHQPATARSHSVQKLAQQRLRLR